MNANTARYRAAPDALTAADPTWLERITNRRVPLGDWHAALERRDDDVNVVIDLER